MRALLVAILCVSGCAYPEFAFTPRDDVAAPEDTEGVVDSSVAIDSTIVEPPDTTTAETAPNDTGAVDTTVVDTAPIDSPGTFMTLAAKGGSWRYLDDGTAPSSTNWRGGGGFDDSKWKTGPAQLGFGDGDEKTVITHGFYPDAGPDAVVPEVDAPDTFIPYTSYYFRRFFTVTDAASFDRITVRLLRDDGAVVYLNGSEIVRSNMPSGSVTNGTFATMTVAGADEDTFFEFVVPAATLKEGSNVIAVEVHQSNTGSSDVSFDLELVGHKP